MSYIVRNMTSRTVILSDLRAELGPYKTLDLEKVVHRERVERSRNLRQALEIGTLCLVKYSVVHGPKRPIEQPNNSMSKEEMEALIRRVMMDYKTEPAEPIIVEKVVETVIEQKDNTEEVGKIVRDSMSELMDSIRQEINSIQVGGPGDSRQKVIPMPSVDQERLAGIQQKAVAEISENVIASVKQGRKIIIKNKNLDNLASELGDDL